MSDGSRTSGSTDKRARESRLAVLRPFAIRDFRLLWTGMAVSLFGDGMFLVAMAWQAYELTDSPGAFALVGIAFTLPMVSLLLLGGVISDRFDRRRIMILSDVIRGLAVLGLGVLAATDVIELWHMIALAAVYGAGDALFPPAFNALVPTIVPKELLLQANSVDHLVRPLALLMLGPALGGLLIDEAGAGGAFFVNAGSFGFSMLMFLLLRPRPLERTSEAGASVLAEIRVGLRFARSHTWLWGSIVMAAFFLLVFLGPWEVLVPFLVKNELGGSARDLGLVFASSGLGAILCSVVFAQRELPRRFITWMYVGFTGEVAAVAIYGVAQELWQLFAVAFVAGVSYTAGGIIWLTLLQRHVPNELLGRITSLDWMVAVSLTPISFALTGPVAGAIGVRETLVGAGIIGAAITFGFLFLPGMRDLERAGR
jgi:MFS family permease